MSDFPSLFLIRYFSLNTRSETVRDARAAAIQSQWLHILCTLAIFCAFTVGSLLLHLSVRQEYQTAMASRSTCKSLRYVSAITFLLGCAVVHTTTQGKLMQGCMFFGRPLCFSVQQW